MCQMNLSENLLGPWPPSTHTTLAAFPLPTFFPFPLLSACGFDCVIAFVISQVILCYRRRPETSHVTSSQFAAYFSLQQFRNSHLRSPVSPLPPYLYLLEQRPSGAGVLLSGAILAAAAALNQTTCEERGREGEDSGVYRRGVFDIPQQCLFSIAPRSITSPYTQLQFLF